MSEEEIWPYWEFLMKKHWFRLVPFVLVIIAAFISGIYVFLWHNEIGIGTGSFWSYTFNDWSMGLIFVYILMLALRELLLVGLPTLAVLGIIFSIMWFTLSLEKREELKAMNKQHEGEKKKHRKGKRTSNGFSGCSALVTITFLIIVAVNGNWNTTFEYLNLQYFVVTYLWAILWVAIIFGIPALIGGTIYLVHKLK
ncbi:MAG: hypothetical protein EAX91_01360 [Candidatus Lokiarchaeota archaeon]|nr:hypothetical protein [Candidatus Lokiarchaeota archaeon]